jgi:hypothetical protein
MGGKMNISNEKTDILPSTIFKELRKITGNSINMIFLSS